MISARFIIVILAFVVALWRLVGSFGFDPETVRGAVPPGVPARYVVRDQEALEALREQLEGLELFSLQVVKRLRAGNVGRRQLFVPEKSQEKKTLSSS